MPPSRKIAFVLAASDHGTMIVNRFDYHMTGKDQGYGVGYDILNGSAFEPSAVELYNNLLNNRRLHYGDGVLAVDCGANIGTFTVEWAKMMSGWGAVLAFEAQERIYYALAGNIAINNCFNAQAILAAVSDKCGTISLPPLDYTAPASFGSVEIKETDKTEFVGQPLRYNSPTAARISALTLDSLGLNRVDLLKIDVEGMEFEVLAGAVELINRTHPMLIVEFIKVNKHALGERLMSLGYDLVEFGVNFVGIHRTDKSSPHFQNQTASEPLPKATTSWRI